MPNLVELRESLYIRHFEAISHSLPVLKLLLVSDYAAKQQEHLKQLLLEDDCVTRLTQSDYQQLIREISLDLTQHQFASALRQLRHRHLLRLYLRELAGYASTNMTTTDWSFFAEAIVRHTIKFCHNLIQPLHGTPCDRVGCPVGFFAIAMGKLGGRELNFSSDIDLIFAYSSTGKTNGKQEITNQEYFTQLVQLFMQIVQSVTPDGFVFRVDLRLRPYGDSGPLVSSIAAMETYYQEQGRDWERYAMVKARLIELDPYGNSQWFERLINPFVYRRYVDFSVIESLRSMKGMIEREVQLNPMFDDIKRGRGGIREVEFIIQSFQLIRGGRLPQLQEQSAMSALQVLREEGLVSHTKSLEQAYWFLRRLENALQARADQQTHHLPFEKTACKQVALALGFDDWEEASKLIEQYRRIINHSFSKVLAKADIYEDEKRLLANQLMNLWHGHVESGLAINLLSSLGYQEPERCYQILSAFRHGPRCRRLSQIARLRLDRFMILLMNELTGVEKTDVVLLQVIHLLESIVGRSAYLALLIENPSVLQELLHWFEHSPFITSLLVNQPFLLEVLIDQDKSWRLLSKATLQKQLQAKLLHSDDEELQIETLRQFKLTCWLLVARAELYGECNSVHTGRFLADVAEVVIHEVVTLACKQLLPRFPAITQVLNRFAIVAYGKLGAREMNYNSDVDLVFLHRAKPSEEALVNRLTQKIIHGLTLPSQSGVLFQVDTRLRPSGSAGLLVSHMDAFVEYQNNQAWTWEHQALARARIIFCNKTIQKQFQQLKQNVLIRERDRVELAHEIQKMRKKMNAHTENDPIKHSEGGLIDLEFLIQYLVLAYPNETLAKKTSTLLQLRSLHEEKVLSDEALKTLNHAFRRFHKALHQSLLQSKRLDVEKEQQAVFELSQRVYQGTTGLRKDD
ncbi:bifunctional [glutamate--ammonia ligase]-adenylyl-L-tyrosine phosphorylase/[glutamate--ammonia-ligase] adenylyltransferase [Legionella impletisoli]|uniref:Glutamate-ammonia-ligase adenylyltransferase n=1 Tax=Legionella impletisoli TaxID=343510 RepID=A0A917NEG4_9GAMM|nr:bifunctional [glutamate--ammonia ligase]-adenylyl-L-tyrosine phosphorylase/[glutamate--ammonia-ligase] adenylyltransferase [Legionella impletisoli]GGI92815.1 glutamate-ammonia-ligase adenylyltransferase [Legionella impletisoli]